MNKRLIVIAALILVLGGFAAVTLLYRGSAPEKEITAATLGESLSQRLVREHSPIIGPREARVTIVEFFDPSCEACRAMYPAVKEIMARYPNDVRLVLRYAPFHPGSEEAVRIMEAARTQNVYVPVLEALLESQPQWHDGDMRSAWTAAAAAGLNVEQATAALNSPDVTATIRQDVADGEAVGIRGTPTFYVNGRQLTDFGPQQLEDLIRSEVQASSR